MKKKALKLPPDDLKLIHDRLAEVCHRGTPEQGYRDSGFWKFLEYVYTKDEHDPAQPVKPFPWDKEYVIWAFTHMLACEKLLLPKSRQIMVSWMLAAYAVWFVRTQPHCLVLVQSEDADKANNLVSLGSDAPAIGRMDFIEQHLPQWLRDPNIVDGTGNKVGELVYSPKRMTPQGVKVPWYGSRIKGLPQGARKVAGHTVSLFISDEAAHQESFEETIIALLPALMSPASTTRFIAASSVIGGAHFNKMVLESNRGLNEGELYAEPENTGCIETAGIVAGSATGSLPDGLRSWDTPSGFAVLEVHYRSDPKKNPGTIEGRDWLKRAERAYIGGMNSPGWQREMEIDYAARGGIPVFPFLATTDSPVFIPRMSVRKVMQRGMSLIAGYDYGTLNPSAFVIWGIDPEYGDWYALEEVYEPCKGYKNHIARIKALPLMQTGKVQYVRCDHSLGFKNQQTMSGLSSIVKLFGDEDLHMVPGRKGAGETLRYMLLDRWSNVEEWRIWDAEERKRVVRGDPPQKRPPRCYITAGCPKLWWEVQRLRLKEHTSAATASRKNAPDEIMDKDDHAYQASAYVLDTRPEARLVRMRSTNGRTWADAEAVFREEERKARYSEEYVR